MRKNAFTLIELLIAVSLIGLLFTIGIAYYQNFSRQQIIIQAAKEFKNNLRHAQSKALAGEKDCSDLACGGTGGICTLDSKTLDGWFVAISSGSYRIYGSCEDTQFGSKTVQLPPTVNLSASATTFYFQPLSRGVSEDLVNFTISGYDRTYQMTLTKAGEIKDIGFPLAPTPTPSPTPMAPTPTPTPTVAPTPTPTPVCARKNQDCTILECCPGCSCHPSQHVCKGSCSP